MQYIVVAIITGYIVRAILPIIIESLKELLEIILSLL